jgi:hypothetical protein
MKQRYTLFLAAFPIVISGWAQPTIDITSYGPVPGNVFPIYSVDDQAAPASGSNITWDYSSISLPGSPTSTVQYVSPLGSDLPGTTVATAGTSRSFFHVDATGYEYLGAQYGSLGGETCSEPRMIMPLPFTMGDTRTNTFQCSGMFAGSTNSNSGTNEFNAIGYGTLSLPYGDVSNVLLVRLDQSTQYNSSSQGTSQSTSVSYYFVKPGVNYPLLTLLSETDQSSGTVTTLTFVLDQSVLGIRESLAQSIGIDLYPNPAHGSADVVFATPASRQISLEVVDMAGQVVAFNRLGASSSGIHREQIDISALNPGVYHIRITDGNGATGVKKLVVQ